MSHRSEPTPNSYRPAGYSPVNRIANHATTVVTHHASITKASTMKCGMARISRKATLTRSRGPGSTTSTEAVYDSSPNGGYASSSSMRYAIARTRQRRKNVENWRMPETSVPVSTIMNQVTMARKYATAPSSPPSPPKDHRPSPNTNEPPSAAPPTRMRWGMARMNRNSVVTRSRFVSTGCTVTVTGYAIGSLNHHIATSPGHQITRSPDHQITRLVDD